VIRTADTKAGDTIVVLGVGGVGINAIQGAHIAGARYIVAVDPISYKRQQATDFGATHVFASADDAWDTVSAITGGQLADACVIATGIAEESSLQPALGLVGKRGRVIVTALGRPDEMHASLNLFELTLYEKQVLGSLYGSCNAQHDIPRLLELYILGMLKLDELVTREYTLEQINEGYEDMREGRNIRGLIRY
jgi:S-(hydroxymethyl)glutathione dehydrogenase/alcohol dehydrogenase